ncbi:MAG: CoA-binding protein [bacterium]
MKRQSIQDVQAFLDAKRMAFVGVSRKEQHLSRKVMEAFEDRGYEVEPVNPAGGKVKDKTLKPALDELKPTPEAVMVLLRGEERKMAVEDALRLGVKTIWLYGVTGPKEVEPEIHRMCEEAGVNLIAGYCPFMFLKDAEGFHRFHGWVWKMLGMYPV